VVSVSLTPQSLVPPSAAVVFQAYPYLQKSSTIQRASLAAKTKQIFTSIDEETCQRQAEMTRKTSWLKSFMTRKTSWLKSFISPHALRLNSGLSSWLERACSVSAMADMLEAATTPSALRCGRNCRGSWKEEARAKALSDGSPIGSKSAFINLSRSATVYFGNSCRSFFSRLTSVVNCSGSCFAKAS
jgi:hypothetical protein